jgi:hypothetical protein
VKILNDPSLNWQYLPELDSFTVLAPYLIEWKLYNLLFALLINSIELPEKLMMTRAQ